MADLRFMAYADASHAHWHNGKPTEGMLRFLQDMHYAEFAEDETMKLREAIKEYEKADSRGSIQLDTYGGAHRLSVTTPMVDYK
ncbi:hypothetical protein PENARI_c001G10762 [Penicillium arizonense]|uniref:Uncharacterized protein n=1 Tax=Penicillium arizonense TaxID=1835702 RepID=A0A1F5LY43_PENAI|nr:hypothetical protein PENARI_c001G10762 [Penicillium arizonense]OGE57909.1 hypothetical protein PENARI_c001G10762 [Penicillium arizonense]